MDGMGQCRDPNKQHLFACFTAAVWDQLKSKDFKAPSVKLDVLKNEVWPLTTSYDFKHWRASEKIIFQIKLNCI